MSPVYHGGSVLQSSPGKSVFEYADALRVRAPTSCGRSGDHDYRGARET